MRQKKGIGTWESEWERDRRAGRGETWRMMMEAADVHPVIRLAVRFRLLFCFSLPFFLYCAQRSRGHCRQGTVSCRQCRQRSS